MITTPDGGELTTGKLQLKYERSHKVTKKSNQTWVERSCLALPAAQLLTFKTPLEIVLTDAGSYVT